MPDQFDDLWTELRCQTDAWIESRAPSRFDEEFFSKQLDEMPCMREFEARVDGLDQEWVAQAYINHVRRDAKTRVHSQVLSAGTSSVRKFFRGDESQEAMFGPDGMMRKPALYKLDVDVLVPIHFLQIREAARREELELKRDRLDIEIRERNVAITLALLDDTGWDGTFSDIGLEVYARFAALEEPPA